MQILKMCIEMSTKSECTLNVPYFHYCTTWYSNDKTSQYKHCFTSILQQYLKHYLGPEQ